MERTDAQPKALDPVYGMTVDPTGPRQHRHAGTTYHFCSDRCLAKFRDDPESFLGEKESAPAAAAKASTIWTSTTAIVRTR